MNKNKQIIKAVMILVLISFTSILYAQNVSYSSEKTSNIDVGEKIVLQNTSTDMPAGVTYKWEFESCSFEISNTIYCEFPMVNGENSIEGSFIHTGSLAITLIAYDANNIIIGSIYSQTFILNAMVGQCNGAICTDDEDFSCSNPNLICNYSFEKIDPAVYDQGLVWFAEPWCNLGSSDLFQRGMTPSSGQGSLDMGIPINDMGVREAHTGDAYAGLISFGYNANGGYPTMFSEYIQTPIKDAIVNGVPTSSLIAGQRYGLSFYIANAEEHKFATDGLMAYFSPSKLGPGGVGTAQQTFNFQSNNPNLLKPFDGTIIDSKDWVQFYSEYIPTTNNIKHLTIGYFHQLNVGDVNTHYKLVNSASLQSAYYYIDDVSLIPLPPAVAVNSPTNCDGVDLTVTGEGAGSYYWNTGETTSSISVNPQTTTVYTVTVTDFYGCNQVVLNSTVTVDPIEKAIIAGNISNCDDVASYSVTNPVQDYEYIWSTQVYNGSQYAAGNFIINGSSNVEIGSSISIDWTSATFPTLPGYVLISCEASPKNSECSIITTYKVYECCEGDIDNPREVLSWHNETITTDIYTTKRIVVNGIVHINSNVYINSPNMFMGPMSKIIVDNNARLSIRNTPISISDCDYMWDGIYTNDPSAVINIEGSTLTGAINGIVSENGGELIIDNVNFSGNKTSVQILNYKKDQLANPPQTYTLGKYKIVNCSFGSQFGYSNLITPYTNLQEETGIKISNVEGVNIGDITGGGNNFYHLIKGIDIYNSKVNVINNTFTNINTVNYPITNSEAAISINSSYVNNLLNICDVKIGGSQSASNTFNNCANSIYSNNSKLNVSENVFNNGFKSILVHNFKNGTQILDNRFKDVDKAIRVENLLDDNRQLLIKDNYFEGIVDGSYTSITNSAIDVINCNSAPNSTFQTKVANNTIKFSGLKTIYTYGIRVQNCDGILVNSNHIVRNATISTINADYSQTIGVRVAQSIGAQIVDNYIYGFGQGLRTYGDLNLTQFSCNDINAFKYGFYWGSLTKISDQGRIGTQGLKMGLNTHNSWLSGPTLNSEKLCDQVSSTDNILNGGDINWYYYDNMGTQYVPNSVDFDLGNIVPTVNNYANTLCAGTLSSGSSTGGGNTNTSGNVVTALFDDIIDPELRDYMFESLMQGEEYLDLQNEYRAYDAEFLYDLLSSDQSMMWLGGDKDADYKAFFDKVKEENIGVFADVYSLIEEGDFASANQLNSSIMPEQFIFSNLKTVLRIYLNTWCNNRYELSTGEYEDLFAIANLTPYAGGDAVYTARIMIDFDPDENGIAYRMKQEDNKTRESLTLYPNPASNKVTIEFTNKTFDNIDAVLNVYSITGKLLYQTSFNTDKSFEELSVDMLKNGVYIYQVSLSNGIEQSGKLVILKN